MCLQPRRRPPARPSSPATWHDAAPMRRHRTRTCELRACPWLRCPDKRPVPVPVRVRAWARALALCLALLQCLAPTARPCRGPRARSRLPSPPPPLTCRRSSPSCRPHPFERPASRPPLLQPPPPPRRPRAASASPRLPAARRPARRPTTHRSTRSRTAQSQTRDARRNSRDGRGNYTAHTPAAGTAASMQASKQAEDNARLCPSRPPRLASLLLPCAFSSPLCLFPLLSSALCILLLSFRRPAAPARRPCCALLQSAALTRTTSGGRQRRARSCHSSLSAGETPRRASCVHALDAGDVRSSRRAHRRRCRRSHLAQSTNTQPQNKRSLLSHVAADIDVDELRRSSHDADR